jgi:hypothetical protein
MKAPPTVELERETAARVLRHCRVVSKASIFLTYLMVWRGWFARLVSRVNCGTGVGPVHEEAEEGIYHLAEVSY